MATSLQRPLFLADSPLTHLNLTTTATFFCPQGWGEVQLYMKNKFIYLNVQFEATETSNRSNRLVTH